MSTSLTEAGPTTHAFSITRTLNHKGVPGLACITVLLDDTRAGDVPIPRFRSIFVDDEEQERTPFVIGAPNFLRECKTHVPPNGFLVTNMGKQMDIFYVSADEEGGILFDAQGRVEARMNGLIAKMDASFQRSPYADFVVTKR